LGTPGSSGLISSSGLQPFLETLAKNNRVMKAYLFTHRQADPDALCSAYGLGEALRKIARRYSNDSEYKIIAPGGASALATSLASKLGVEFREDVNKDELDSAEFIAVLDTGERRLLGELELSIAESKAKKAAIDHHRQENSASRVPEWTGFDLVVVQEDATSTSEIIVNELDSDLLDERTASVLMAGVLFDSQHLGIANRSTLAAALKLVLSGARIEASKSLLRSQPDRSEIIARLKSSQRLSYKEVARYFLAQSPVSSFHAAVARMLIEIGSDLGVAYGESGGESRVSVRSSQRLHRETGIDLGMILKKIADENSSYVGGGHSTAASISGRFSPKEMADRIWQEAESLLLRKL
jgi:nanoRNase/pAp phosphatase (c-di-AMP/oligoRNAs hydrolase)